MCRSVSPTYPLGEPSALSHGASKDKARSTGAITQEDGVAKLPESFSQLVLNDPLPIGSNLFGGSLTIDDLEIVARQASALLDSGMAHQLVDRGVAPGLIPSSTTGLLEALTRVETVSRQTRASEPIGRVQQAMQAIAAAVPDAPRPLALPTWGTDGSFGGESVAATQAFRSWMGLPQSDEVDDRMAGEMVRVLQEASPYDPWSVFGDVEIPSYQAQRIVHIARSICAASAEHPFSVKVGGKTYTFTKDHFGWEPVDQARLEFPGGVGYGLSRGYWKCNIFGGGVLSLAGCPVPTFPVNDWRHYPRAEKFGDSLAAKRGWTSTTHLDHRDPQDETQALAGPEHDEEIRVLLLDMQPGDIFFADNPGEPGNEGGHARICVRPADPSDPDMAPLFAQASQPAALERRDGMDRLGEGQTLQLWLVRFTGDLPPGARGSARNAS